MEWDDARYCRLIADHSHDLVSVVDLSGAILYVSHSVARVGYAQSDLIGRNIYEYIHDDDVAQVAQAISLLEHTGVQTVVYRSLVIKESFRWVEATLRLSDVDGRRRVIVVTRDITERKTAEDEIRTLAFGLEAANRQLAELVMTDPLTGIGNRRMLMATLETLLQEADRGRSLSVLMVDIDHFKSFNDVYGHAAGDEVICQVATTMKSTIRKIDSVARYGGEEFVVALAAGSVGALILAEKLRSAIAATQNQYRRVTVSIGIAGYTKGDTTSSIICSADKSLYEAKRSGRNRVVKLLR